MQLDMLTMLAVDITVTTVLGLLLVFTWARGPSTRFVEGEAPAPSRAVVNA